MGELCVLPIGGEHGFRRDSFLYGHPTATSFSFVGEYKVLRVSSVIDRVRVRFGVWGSRFLASFMGLILFLGARDGGAGLGHIKEAYLIYSEKQKF